MATKSPSFTGGVFRMQFNCTQCGTHFTADAGAKRKYCSRECYYAASVVPLPKGTCSECGKEFVWNRAHKPQKYCSRECAQAGLSKNTTRACEQCGTVFPVRFVNSQRKFCSPECAAASMDTRIVTMCEECGAEFLIPKWKQENEGKGKYCSPACYHKAQDTQVVRACEICGTEFMASPCEIARRGARYCSRDCYLLSDSFRAHGHARGGKRDDLGGTYFRSSWEANYARILNLLMEQHSVAHWEFEPDIFELDGEKYLPDFKVFEDDGSFAYHEVKGYMDKTSKRKLTKMGEEHPDISVILIDAGKYGELEQAYAPIIDSWEAKNG